MNYNPKIHHRRSIRLKEFDYTNPAAYFITICVQNRDWLLGEIVENQMLLNVVGTLAKNQWEQLPKFFEHIELDEFQFMPSHLHGIIIINKRPDQIVEVVGAKHPSGNFLDIFDCHVREFLPLQTGIKGTQSGSIGANKQNYCSATTQKINRIRKIKGVKFWQRNY